MERTHKTTAQLRMSITQAYYGKTIAYIIPHYAALKYTVELAKEIAQDGGLVWSYFESNREMQTGKGKIKFVVMDDVDKLRGIGAKVEIDHAAKPNERQAAFLREIDTT